MRILVITDLYPPVAFGGYESETAALVDGLRARHDILVLTSDLDAPGAEEGILRELPFASSHRREAFLAPGKTARAVKVMRRVLADFEPELVYVANSVAIPQAAPLVAARSGLPVVYRLSEHWMASSLFSGDRFLRNLVPGQRGVRAPWAAAMRLVAGRLELDPPAPHRAAVSWASNALRERVELPLQVELERTIHPASSQAPVFEAIERRPSGERSFLYLGRMTTAKGIEVAYRALAQLEDARLVTVGTASPGMQRKLDGLARELGISDRIELRGRISTEDLAAVLGTIGAIVLPTVEWDVFPLVLIEAGLAGVPIVASRIGGVPEAVEDGSHALLVEPGDASALAAALRDVFDQPDAAAARAQRARERMSGLSLEHYREQSERLILDAAEVLR